MDTDLIAALSIIRRAVTIDGTEAIYLHAASDEPAFGLLLRGKQKEIAEDALNEAGLTYEHSHIDGDD